eukprot:CAMPEP_0183309278 /NCGR_PEP_ID=MMETSP0160_2-20130417/24799_1 /TAXON_ID=2839 ORGANISM="Odontella Sinensis, Strain Grunow 1884" /NCGR_SAMPLE_ID=MMETSP0160_2 /ASSEMBLY_ACC=CAM_ASM_000250 /LENGTH=124 /DNA_ID=CAMNT_0025473281 /DNA_START=45 /DNA_END=419 /DNA_ORIENTATION=+
MATPNKQNTTGSLFDYFDGPLATPNYTHQGHESKEEVDEIMSILGQALAVSTEPSSSLPSQHRRPDPRSERNWGVRMQREQKYPRDSLIALLNASVGPTYNQHMLSANQQPRQDASLSQASNRN